MRWVDGWMGRVEEQRTMKKRKKKKKAQDAEMVAVSRRKFSMLGRPLDRQKKARRVRVRVRAERGEGDDDDDDNTALYVHTGGGGVPVTGPRNGRRGGDRHARCLGVSAHRVVSLLLSCVVCREAASMG